MEESIIKQIQQEIQAKNIVKAQHLLAEMLVDDPLNEEGWLLLSELVPPEKSLESLERVLKINPENFEAQMRIAKLKNESSIDNIERNQSSVEELFQQTDQEKQLSSVVGEEFPPLESSVEKEEQSVSISDEHLDSHPLLEENFPVIEVALESQIKKRRVSVFRHPLVIIGIIFFVIVAILLAGIGWYYFYGPCGVQSVMDADQKINAIKSRWDQTLYVASKSSRVVLAQPVLDMIDIQRELRKLSVPSCMELPKVSLDKSMKYTIEAYDRFFYYESEVDVRKRLNDAGMQRKLYYQQMQVIYQCAPLSCP